MRPLHTSNILIVFLLVVTLILPITIAVGIASMIFDETIDRNDSKSTQSRSSVAAPLAMKHPCTLYLVEYMRFFNETNKDEGDREGSRWVCELDAEDRVSDDPISRTTSYLYLSLNYQSLIDSRPHSTHTSVSRWTVWVIIRFLFARMKI
jgi:hypothetical protein